MNWLDSHCHLNDEAFKDDLDNVLDNMVSNDVLKAMIISNSLDDYNYGLSINHPKIDFKQLAKILFFPYFSIFLANLILSS